MVSGKPSIKPTSDQFTVMVAFEAGRLPGQASDSNPAASGASALAAAAISAASAAFRLWADRVILMAKGLSTWPFSRQR